MYFIFTLLSFLTVALLSFTASAFIPHEVTSNSFLVIGIVGSIATMITTFAMMFQNMYFRNYIKRNINEARQYMRRITEKKVDLTRYKDEFKQTLTEMYPEYEKELFKGMADHDAKQLEMIMVKYPELKFDGVLNTYIGGVKDRLKSINDYEKYITKAVKIIEDQNTNGWMLGTLELPNDIKVK